MPAIDPDHITAAGHLAAALLAGGLIGFERSYHSRPAGFRTHTLVCLASSLLMLVTLFQWKWLPGVEMDTIRTDPTRMAQGIMTGIGFLGAGVIVKEGLSVRGLTTAASIWITAAIGILIGIGYYFPAALATVFTVGTLALLRKFEDYMPSQSYAFHSIRFDRQEVLSEAEVRALLAEHGFKVSNMSYCTADGGTSFEYQMTLRSTGHNDFRRLSKTLIGLQKVREFRISSSSD